MSEFLSLQMKEIETEMEKLSEAMETLLKLK